MQHIHRLAFTPPAHYSFRYFFNIIRQLVHPLLTLLGGAVTAGYDLKAKKKV